METKKEIIIIKEGAISSIIKDTFTFAMFAGLLYFNHKYLSGSTFIDFLFILTVILTLIGHSSNTVKKFKSNQEAIDYLAPKDGKDK